MNGYKVPSGYGEIELIEKRSRFIARVWLVETEDEAIARIKEMRDKHWDATHNVYAYILREGGTMRYSDDGEPQGTSGMPTLGVFRSAEVFNVCCVVTRYFGGVLLGTGGLVRAYSQAASKALEAAGISMMRLWRRMSISCDYSRFERVRSEIEAADGVIESTDYGADVCMSVLIDDETADAFTERMIDVTAGLVCPTASGAEYRAVRIK